MKWCMRKIAIALIVPCDRGVFLQRKEALAVQPYLWSSLPGVALSRNVLQSGNTTENLREEGTTGAT